MNNQINPDQLQFNGMTIAEGAAELEESLATYANTHLPANMTLDDIKNTVRGSGGFLSLADYMDDPDELVPFWANLTPAMELDSDLTFFSWAAKVKEEWINGL